MSIEIRELIIRAILDTDIKKNTSRRIGSRTTGKTGDRAKLQELELIKKMVKEKNER